MPDAAWLVEGPYYINQQYVDVVFFLLFWVGIPLLNF